MKLLYFVVSAVQRPEQCPGLDDLATNVNPTYLTNCVRDENCTQVACQTDEELRNVFTSIMFTPSPCVTTPGMSIKILIGENIFYEEDFFHRNEGINITSSPIGPFVLQVSVQRTATNSIDFTVRCSHTITLHMHVLIIHF